MSELRRVMGFARPYRRDMLAAMVLLGLVVLADVSIPRLVQVVIDEGVAKGDLPKVVSTSLLMVGASILSSLFMVGNTVFAVRAARGLEADLRERLFNHIQEFSFSNLDSFTSGQLITRLTSDISQIQGFLLMLLRMFTRAPLMFVGSLAMMVATDLGLAKVMVSLVVFTALLVTLFINRVSPYFERVQRRLEWLNQVVRENLEGVRVVKAFVRQDYEKQRFDEANQRLFETQLGFMQLLNAFFPLVLLVMNLGVVAIIYLGGLRVYTGSTSVGTIMAFTNYVFATMFPVMMLGMMAGQISAASASSARIMEVLDTEPSIKQGPNVQPPSTIRGEVRFEDVEFSYQPDGGVPVLQGISFTAEPGERVAILGATGSGKTSLVSLIPRFYDVTKGSVKVDGVDVREWDLEALRSQIGFCLQESVLFTGTVADNIRWGRRDASMEEVVEAAKLAQAHEFIQELPQGYETVVGERGVNLSGGQKQRIAIARAILIKPRILILDDSTSAVDTETEIRLEEALEAAFKGVTTFVIAQRISTVLTADKILVLENGRVAAEGSHQELMASSPVYREIYESQLGGEEG